MKTSFGDWSKVPYSEIPSSLELDQNIFGYVTQESQIIDLGCGRCGTLKKLSNLGFKNLTGIDINPDVIEKVHLSDEFKKIRLVAQNLLDNELAEGRYDYAIMEALLTILVDDKKIRKAFTESFRILKKGGYLHIEDFFQNWHVELYRTRYIKGAKEFKTLGVFPVYNEVNKVKYLARHFNLTDLSVLLVETGFTILDLRFNNVRSQSGNNIIGFSLLAKK